MMVMMIEPMPDELGLAHAGRIVYWNGLSGFLDLRRRTLGTAGRYPKGAEFTQQFVDTAKRLSIDPEQYLIRHSMLPFHLAYSAHHDQNQTYRPLTNKWLKPADGLISQAARFCCNCAEEDMKILGFSYWKRVHQLPGVDTCTKHGNPLHRTLDVSALLRTPSFYLDNIVVPEESNPGANHPAICRYRQFALQMLGQHQRILATDLRRCIKTRCSALGISRSLKGKKRTASLSLLVRSNFPEDWLKKHYPKLLLDHYQGRDLCIDAAFLGQGAPGYVIAMILAALFDNVDHFMHELSRASAALDSNSKETSDDPFQSRKAFVHIFSRAKGNTSEVARLIGRHVSSAHFLRLRYGFPSPTYAATSEKNRIFDRLCQASWQELQAWGDAMKACWASRSGVRIPGKDWEIFVAIVGRDANG
jgi:hypothetical protein